MSGERDSTNPDRSNVSGAIEWSQKQFEALAEERRALDRYMWQVPIATLGVAALFLNASKVICGDVSQSPVLLKIMLVLSSFICFYAAFSLCRFQARRRLREIRMERIEDRVASICSPAKDGVSAITTSSQVTETAKKSDRWEIRKFGRFPTTRLGV